MSGPLRQLKKPKREISGRLQPAGFSLAFLSLATFVATNTVSIPTLAQNGTPASRASNAQNFSGADLTNTDATEARSLEKLKNLDDSTSGAGSDASLSTQLAKPPTAAKKRTQFMWKMGLDSESFANQKEQAQVVGFGLSGDLRMILLPDLMLKVKAGVALQSGYAQSEFGDNTPHNGLALSEAVLQYRPWKPLIFQAGSIDQSFVGSPFLPTGSFPGTLQKIEIGSDRLGMDVIAQETIPTSTTLSTKTVDNEPTPYYATQGLILKARPLPWWKVSASGLHYKFESLPSEVASESTSYGNTVLSTGPNSSQFLYQFDGWMTGAETTVRMGRGFSWTVDGHMLQNTAAPVSFRNAQYLETRFGVALPKDIDLVPKAMLFFAESDVAPGFYNSSDLGHDNRQGWGVAMDMIFKKEKFKLGATYTNANVIDQSPFQTQQQFIQLRFESLYEIL